MRVLNLLAVACAAIAAAKSGPIASPNTNSAAIGHLESSIIAATPEKATTATSDLVKRKHRMKKIPHVDAAPKGGKPVIKEMSNIPWVKRYLHRGSKKYI